MKIKQENGFTKCAKCVSNVNHFCYEVACNMSAIVMLGRFKSRSTLVVGITIKFNIVNN